MSSPLTIINPNDRNWTSHRYVLSFGTHGCTHLMVYASSLDDALEECAEWLADNKPGLVYLTGQGNQKRDPIFDELLGEVCKEKGLAWPFPADLDFSDSDAMQPYWDAEQDAYQDLDQFEACAIGKDDWCLTLEDPTRSEIKAFIASLAERHYSDEPVVKVA